MSRTVIQYLGNPALAAFFQQKLAELGIEVEYEMPTQRDVNPRIAAIPMTIARTSGDHIIDILVRLAVHNFRRQVPKQEVDAEMRESGPDVVDQRGIRTYQEEVDRLDGFMLPLHRARQMAHQQGDEELGESLRQFEIDVRYRQMNAEFHAKVNDIRITEGLDEILGKEGKG